MMNAKTIFGAMLVFIAQDSFAQDRTWEGHRAYVQLCRSSYAHLKGTLDFTDQGEPIVNYVTYRHTNRTLERLRSQAYPKGELNWDRLHGKRVLDVACGEGAAVAKMRNEEGIDAIGVDIFLDPETHHPDYLKQGDWKHLPIADHSEDIVMMNSGIWLYMRNYPDAELLEILREMIRVKADGGEILITGVSDPERLEALAEQSGLHQLDKYRSHDQDTLPGSKWTFRFVSK